MLLHDHNTTSYRTTGELLIFWLWRIHGPVLTDTKYSHSHQLPRTSLYIFLSDYF
jgi:hypothetical protein